MRGNQHGTIASMLAGKLPEFQYKNWNSGSFCVAKHINNWSRGKKQFSRLCMAHFFSRRYHILGGQTVKFHMIFNKFLNQSNGSSCHKGTEESTDADSIKMMKDQKGKKYGRCQTGEVERCLDPVVLFVQQFRQIARKISVGTIGSVENGFGISILPYMDIVRLHHITAIPVQTSSWKSKFYIARRKYGIRTGQEEAFFQHWRK